MSVPPNATLFPPEVLLAYLAAVLVVIAAPGPDNILAISRGLSQGRAAAALSSIGVGLGILFHTVAAALGLALVLQASPLAFWVVKAAGAGYLLWLGYKAISSRSLIFTVLGSFAAQLSAWLSRRPRAVAAANVGAGLTFIAAGLSILALERRR